MAGIRIEFCQHSSRRTAAAMVIVARELSLVVKAWNVLNHGKRLALGANANAGRTYGRFPGSLYAPSNPSTHRLVRGSRCCSLTSAEFSLAQNSSTSGASPSSLASAAYSTKKLPARC